MGWPSGTSDSKPGAFEIPRAAGEHGGIELQPAELAMILSGIELKSRTPCQHSDSATPAESPKRGENQRR